MLRLEPVSPKRLALREVDPFLTQCLFELPQILERREGPEIRGRFFQDLVADDAVANEDWHKLVDFELHHLFASAGEIVARDLTGLQDGTVEFPIEHVSAWLNAINQARLILAEQHQVTALDLARLDFDPHDQRDVALARILVFEDVLVLLIDHES